jgi:hypothetical protein
VHKQQNEISNTGRKVNRELELVPWNCSGSVASGGRREDAEGVMKQHTGQMGFGRSGEVLALLVEQRSTFSEGKKSSLTKEFSTKRR